MTQQSQPWLSAQRVRALAAIVLVIFMVAAESFAAVHALDRDAHTAGEICKVCVTATSFASAAPVHVSLPAVAAAVAEANLLAVPEPTRSTFFIRPPSRGPPPLP